MKEDSSGFLLLSSEESVNGCVELFTALQKVELEHEEVSKEIAAELLHKAACSCCGAT